MEVKRYYRTYKINDEGEELLAGIFTEYTDENDIESEFEHTYPSTEDREICWTSGIFDKLEG